MTRVLRIKSAAVLLPPGDQTLYAYICSVLSLLHLIKFCSILLSFRVYTKLRYTSKFGLYPYGDLHIGLLCGFVLVICVIDVSIKLHIMNIIFKLLT